jgi:hypothetical protein
MRGQQEVRNGAAVYERKDEGEGVGVEERYCPNRRDRVQHRTLGG